MITTPTAYYVTNGDQREDVERAARRALHETGTPQTVHFHGAAEPCPPRRCACYVIRFGNGA